MREKTRVKKENITIIFFEIILMIKIFFDIYMREKTRKNVKKENITIIFFEIILMIKLYHWKTLEYSEHKATDEYYEKLNKNMDRFMEVFLGEDVPKRMKFPSNSKITLLDCNKKELIEKLNKFKYYLNKEKLYDDLYNIRDEIIADTNQLLYLLSLS
jgi:hypothetical protein